jgi:hypothetical protein
MREPELASMTWGGNRKIKGTNVPLTLEQVAKAAGQRTMIVAKLYPEGTRGRGNTDPALNTANSGGFNRQRLAEARLILRVLPEGHRALAVVLELL